MNRSINITRELILHKGYAKKIDIQRFIPCGYDRALEIYNEIRNEVEISGKKNMHNSVLAKRLLPYIGLTEKQVFDYADKEKIDSAKSIKNG